MSAETTVARTFFGRKEAQYPPLSDSDKQVQTVPFLAASKHILEFFDKLGTAFFPVKKDVGGNIEKLETKYKQDPEKFVTIRAMLEDEVANKNTTLAQIGALWLKRGLEFIVAFLNLLVEDHNEVKAGKKKGEDATRPLVLAAYEKTLKPFHGFIVSKVFSGVARFCPNKTELKKSLKLVPEVADDEVVADLENYTAAMMENIKSLDDTLKELNLDSQEKV